MIKISIIVPLYNVEQFIEKCVSSVYNQNLQHKEFELIIVNDGSTDQSLSIAQDLIANKPNAKIISQQNKGLGGARNTGVLNANGEYLIFLDTDDWLLPNVLGHIVDLAIDEKLDILEFAAQGVNTKGAILYHVKNKSRIYLSGCEYYNAVRYMNSACNKLYKRTFITDNHLLFLEKIYIEDFEFNTRCLINATRVMATDKLVAQFLQSENSITRNTDEAKKQKMIGDILFVIKITEKLYHKHVANKVEHNFFLERLSFLVATLFYQLLKSKATYKEMNTLRLQLIEDGAYYVEHKIFDDKKNLFRILLLKNFWTFRIIKLFVK